MKKFRALALMGCLIIVGIIACQRDSKELQQPTVGKGVIASATCNPNAYAIVLESKTVSSGNWSWVWSAQNTNPGNGTGGTYQNMSHWGMQFGTCFDWTDVVGAAYSLDSGATWISFTPTYVVDPSQSCVTTPVLKFNVGTSGNAKTYYKLILNTNYSIDPAAFGYYKSGSRNPCCTFTFNGVGCPIDDWCAYSQGFWFASPNGIWCQDVVFGANSYTQAQGDNIWWNAPPNSVAKKAFTQASALQLSMACSNGGDPIPADILDEYNTCVNFLAGLTYNNILTGNTYTAQNYPAVNAAQGAIGAWIQLNHCPQE